MDGSRFDAATRALSGRGTRRGVLARALAIAVGGATLVDEGRVDARATCRRDGAGCTRDGQCCTTVCMRGQGVPRVQRNRCGCPAPRTMCGGVCCPEGQMCSGGACVAPCSGLDAQNPSIEWCMVTTESTEAYTCSWGWDWGSGDPENCTSSAACQAMSGSPSSVCATALASRGGSGLSPVNPIRCYTLSCD